MENGRLDYIARNNIRRVCYTGKEVVFISKEESSDSLAVVAAAPPPRTTLIDLFDGTTDLGEDKIPGADDTGPTRAEVAEQPVVFSTDLEEHLVLKSRAYGSFEARFGYTFNEFDSFNLLFGCTFGEYEQIEDTSDATILNTQEGMDSYAMRSASQKYYEI